MPDKPTTDLIENLRFRIADPGAFLAREHDQDDDGERIYETIPSWSARAVAAGIEDGTLGHVPASRLADVQEELARTIHTLDLARRELGATREEADRFGHELAFARKEAKSIYDTCKQVERERDTLREVARGNKRHVATLSVLLERVEKLTVSTDGDDLDDGAEIPAGEIRRAIQEPIRGTALVPGSSRRAPEQRVCRVCGCTDDAACEGGCWWVPDPSGAGDLCSTCALASRRAQEPEGFTARYDAACDAVKAAGYAFGVEQANMLLIGLRAADRPAGESQASEPTDDEIAVEIDRAEEMVEAEAQAHAEGYAEAVARLRDDARYRDWWTSGGVKPDAPIRRHLADYLETVGPDGIDVTTGRWPAREQAVVRAAIAWRKMRAGITAPAGPRALALMEAVDALPHIDETPAPVAANPTINQALCADGIHEADGPCCSTRAVDRPVDLDDRAPRPPAHTDAARLLDQRAESWATAEEDDDL